MPRRNTAPLGIYYHGSINLRRVPLSLIKAAGICGIPVHLRIVGYETLGSKGSIEQLRNYAREFSGNLWVELRGPTSRYNLFSLTEDMHIGWVSYNEDGADGNLLHLAGASNKAFDYLAMGLPLITNNTPEWISLFAQDGYALTCDPTSHDSIAMQLKWAYANPHAIAEMGESARQRILAEWNYEQQFSKVMHILENRSDD